MSGFSWRPRPRRSSRKSGGVPRTDRFHPLAMKGFTWPPPPLRMDPDLVYYGELYGMHLAVLDARIRRFAAGGPFFDD